MMKTSHVTPELLKSAFSCPHCNTFATQTWGRVDAKVENHYIRIPDFRVSRCSHCLQFTVWAENVAIFPESSQSPPASPDLPRDIKFDFEEARSLLRSSSRCAAALFRLAFRKMCRALGASGTDLEKDVDYFIQRGVNPKIKLNLEHTRIIGPEAVKPGMIDPRDDTSIAVQISQLINIIVNTLVTQPRFLDELNKRVDEERIGEMKRRTIFSQNVKTRKYYSGD